jgi:GNAT superfamily N-acetyltransferase
LRKDSSQDSLESFLTIGQPISHYSSGLYGERENLPIFSGTALMQYEQIAFTLQGMPLTIRPYISSDQSAIFRLLSVLPSLYPGGYNWLERRLGDVGLGKARCSLAITHWGPVGVTIETPKQDSRLKLSTFFVHPAFRGLNIGTHLLQQCYERWIRDELDQVHITADLKIAGTLSPLLARYGFRVKAIDLERYGPQRDEIILSWSPNKV